MSGAPQRRRLPVARLAVGAALVLAAVLRLAWIASDPPARLSWSNGIFTDPPVMVHAARNAVLFGTWILDYNKDLWIFPLMNALTRLAYALAGPGRVPTIILSGLAGVVTVAAVAWGLRRSLGRRAAVLGAFLCATQYFLVMFSRIPIAENVTAALILTAAALAIGGSRWELVAAGALAVGATLFGKFHAVGVLPGLVVFLALRPRPMPSLLALVSGGTVVFIGWLLAIFLPHRIDILSHVANQSTGLHGEFPFAWSPDTGLKGLLESIAEGLGEFFNTVRRCWMFYRAPVIGALGGLFALWTILNGSARRARLADGSALYAFLFLSLWLYFGVLPYKAPRYFVMIAPLLTAGAAGALELLLRKDDFHFRPPVRWDEHLPLAVWIYSFVFTGLDAVKHYASMSLEVLSVPPTRISDADYDAVVKLFAYIDTFHQGLVWAGILGIVLYMLVLWNPEILGVFGRPRVSLDRTGLRRLAVTLATAAFVIGLTQWGFWAVHRTRHLEDAKSSLPRMIGPDAAVLGAIAPAMTQDSSLRCYPYFGPPGERGLLEKYGITHVMLSAEGDRALLEERFPGLLDSTRTVHLWPVRTMFSGTMELRRVPRSYRGVPLHSYEPTAFERGVDALADSPQEALELFSEHRALVGDFPELISLESACWFKLGDYDEAEKGVRKAIAARPRDPAHYRSLSLVHLKRGDRAAAVEDLLTAARLDPSDEEVLSMLQELTR